MTVKDKIILDKVFKRHYNDYNRQQKDCKTNKKRGEIMTEKQVEIMRQLDNIPETQQELILREMEGYIKGRRDAENGNKPQAS